MREGFNKVTKSQAMRAMEEFNLEVYVEVDGEMVPFEGSSDEVFYENEVFLKSEDLESMND